ncbi:hypothetical protein [Shumkonia mesophila]|uniref:hypothetical protein n=1 Tax=Shumkonia mesophila TaxID=2838854 RepID=UPI002934FDCE|nr:hypothetical protein [Shumkonia mesophila]
MFAPMADSSDPNVWTYIISAAIGLVGAVAGTAGGIYIERYRARLNREGSRLDRDQQRNAIEAALFGEANFLHSNWSHYARESSRFGASPFEDAQAIRCLKTPFLEKASGDIDLFDMETAAAIARLIHTRSAIDAELGKTISREEWMTHTRMQEGIRAAEKLIEVLKRKHIKS